MSKRSKRVIGIVIACTMVLMVFGAVGTGAWFRDRATAQSGSITAGTLDLTVNDSNAATPVSITVSADKFAPGSYAYIGSFKVKNIGNIDGTLKAEFANKVDAENTITPPETMFGDGTATGELSSQIVVVATTTNYGPINGHIDYFDVPANSPIRGRWTQDIDGRMNAGTEKTIYVYAYWPADGDADNLAQGDSVTFNINLVLTQTGANPAY